MAANWSNKKIIKNDMTRAAAMKLAKEKGYEYGSSSFVHDKLNEGDVKEDAIYPKATPSDYLEVAHKGTPEEMVAALEKEGIDASEKAAKAALKRHKEKNADKSLQEATLDLKRLAGL